MDAALEHFASCGLHPLPGQEAAEFLSQVALPVDQDPLLAQGGSPLSADQLGQRFWSSSQGLRLAVRRLWGCLVCVSSRSRGLCFVVGQRIGENDGEDVRARGMVLVVQQAGSSAIAFWLFPC